MAQISKDIDTKTLTQAINRKAWKAIVEGAMATWPKSVYDDDDDNYSLQVNIPSIPSIL